MTVRLLIILLLLSSCESKKRVPDYVIKPEKMGNILRDMLKADALAQEVARYDSSKNVTTINLQMYNSIYEIYSITPKQFDTSYAFYEKNPDFLLSMFDSLSQRQLRAFKAKDRTFKADSTLK